MINSNQEQFASPQNRLFRHIDGPPLYEWGSAAATAAAAVVAIGIGVVVAAVAVKQQDDDDDEQQPGAVDVTAKEIPQTHRSYPPFRKPLACFHFHIMTVWNRGDNFLKKRENL